MKTLLKAVAALVLLLALVAAAGLSWAWWKTDSALAQRFPPRQTLGMAAAVQAAPVDLGRQIVTVRNGCVDCHGADLGGATVVENPMIGKLSGPNLTPVRMKAWSDDEIAVAVRYGVSRDGRPLILMPSHEYQHLSKDDVAAIVAYLRSVASVDRDPGATRLGPVGWVLFATGQAPFLPAFVIDQKAGFATKPAEAPTAEFGRYLAASACSGCHGAEFRGGPIPGGPPDWAPAASLRLGADSRWSAEAFATSVRTTRSGIDGHAIRPPMPVALYAKMTDTEVGALWAYLSTLR